MSNPLRRSPNPLLLQIPVRPWLRALSDEAGRALTLAEVPEETLEAIRRRGFHGIWLMGVWTTGPAGRSLALGYPDLLSTYESLLPDWTPADVGGSPYSIRAYAASEKMGGNEALGELRRRLHEKGLGLVLDFVPNHVALDHPWLDEQPALLVRGAPKDLVAQPSGWFVHTAPDGTDHIYAHGRDPHFPGWSDTCQIDYRRRETREAMTEVLRGLAGRCDGLRCDMAMLVLDDVFRGTWGTDPDGESGAFWSVAIPEVRRHYPELVLIAEVYWGLEGRMLEVGFDFTYDKDLYDKLVAGDLAGVRHRAGIPLESQAHCVRFLENHDEPRAMSTLGPERSVAAAALAYTLPGMRFFQDGQERGWRHRPPIQLARYPSEPTDERCRSRYEELFVQLSDPVFHEGRWQPAAFAGPDRKPAPESLFGNRWTAGSRTRIVVANLADSAASGRLLLPELTGGSARISVRVTSAQDGTATPDDFERDLREVAQDGIPIEVPAFGFGDVRVEPTPVDSPA